MKAHALTPVFRWLDSRAASDSERCFPSAVPGSHGWEMIWLACAAFALTAAGVVPATAGLTAGLRWPLVALLVFALPQLAMLALSFLTTWLPPARRAFAHDWICLTAMTAGAAGLSAGSGWTAAVGLAWLAFAALNLACLFLPALRRRKT